MAMKKVESVEKDLKREAEKVLDMFEGVDQALLYTNRSRTYNCDPCQGNLLFRRFRRWRLSSVEKVRRERRCPKCVTTMPLQALHVSNWNL